MKKFVLTAAVVAMPLGLVAGTAGIAGAGGPGTDVSHATITCTTVTGGLKFAPALTTAGGQPLNTNVKLAISGCTVSGVAGVTVSAGKGAGVLHAANNSATALAGTTTVTGQINVKWSSNVKLASKTSTLTVTATTGGTSGSYASISIGSGQATVSGDFAGTDSGTSPAMYVESTQTIGTFAGELAGPKGIKVLTIGTDGTHLLGNSLHLG